ncbi:MAG: tRNA (N(6)-L-threonylcarbamoyladenosine(37)-C(2))-methylthiotransferase MtaB [Chromatiaceae bacterium]|nr:tRNA (N(6)-L-threonylcarbamoyladenosine(37)-C(2))-methylthiotransferase MtaB [Gammaproteobacteria bacterium]MCP5300995.1 tRNA (N(6)-L-threonylcarbamoyladenosine(37)-C(2))-methylthiotransferase MtaB [Chromatiaceae bacterium]MCP5421532.1 tRNA (N(6)-L-threonylcarbamoyladenosine(37)-C(2))-methylthiotransferase MtaB [Chromatiaceae bacterium]
MRVFMKALGCRLNEAELETWGRDCRERGFTLAADAADADLVVINTCAVTGESVRKSRQLIRRAQRGNPQAKLVVSGCYASLQPEQTAAELGVDLVVPNPDKDRLISIAAERLDLPVMPETATEPGENALLARGRHRAFIKVQDGCRYRCAFCIVTKARGDERSRPIADVVDEVRRVHAEGVNEVVLAGVHLGGYGSGNDADLKALIEAVLADSDVPRVRLGSLEPWELPVGFWSLFDNPRLMPHLHLPIQSGADSVLRRMSRRCRTAEYRELVGTARAAVPDFNVTTDIIVGFPGETESEWLQTLAFAQEMAFGHIHIFAYSPRAGTKAAGMPGQIERKIKRRRSRQLNLLAQHSQRALLERHIGCTTDVLVEQRLEDGRCAGYSPNYLRVDASPTGMRRDLENAILRVRCTGLSPDGDVLHAEAV